jgi:hypothetical protein
MERDYVAIERIAEADSLSEEVCRATLRDITSLSSPLDELTSRCSPTNVAADRLWQQDFAHPPAD